MDVLYPHSRTRSDRLCDSRSKQSKGTARVSSHDARVAQMNKLSTMNLIKAREARNLALVTRALRHFGANDSSLVLQRGMPQINELERPTSLELFTSRFVSQWDAEHSKSCKKQPKTPSLPGQKLRSQTHRCRAADRDTPAAVQHVGVHVGAVFRIDSVELLDESTSRNTALLFRYSVSRLHPDLMEHVSPRVLSFHLPAPAARTGCSEMEEDGWLVVRRLAAVLRIDNTTSQCTYEHFLDESAVQQMLSRSTRTSATLSRRRADRTVSPSQTLLTVDDLDDAEGDDDDDDDTSADSADNGAVSSSGNNNDTAATDADSTADDDNDDDDDSALCSSSSSSVLHM